MAVAEKLTLHIIHLPVTLFIEEEKRKAAEVRLNNLKKEMQEQDIDYILTQAIYNQQQPFKGCTQSHKNIVRYAQQKKMPMVAIAEDDIRFFGAGAWDYFISQIPVNFDIYMGVSYSQHNYNGGVVNNYFDSTTLYVIHSRFYRDFLNINENNHLDRELSRLIDEKEFKIVDKYVAYQANGYSFIAGKSREYEWRLANAPKFGD